jgi:hypothetical protein
LTTLLVQGKDSNAALPLHPHPASGNAFAHFLFTMAKEDTSFIRSHVALLWGDAVRARSVLSHRTWPVKV